MHISKRSGIKLLVAAAAAVAMVPFAVPSANAETETFTQDIPFSSLHPCTGEFVDGDSTVHTTITVETTTSGNMNVHVHQHTIGTQLIGETSGDMYNFNDSQDEHSIFTVGNQGGHSYFHTIFVHTTEAVANLEQPGLDDFYVRFLVVVSPGGVPTIVQNEADCH